MALAGGTLHDCAYDNVMVHLTRWLTRHLNNSALLLWLVKQGGRPHGDLSSRIGRRLDELGALEQDGRREELERIRANAPDAIPDARMRTLWRLLLSGRLKLIGEDTDLYEWRSRFAKDGLTATLRLELREMLAPRVHLREPFEWPSGMDEDDEAPAHIRQIVDWDICFAVRDVHANLHDQDGNENWRAALPALLPDFTALLRDALDLMRELGDADDRRDLSYSSQPSISAHPQNSAFRDWTALIDLNRDAWLATIAKSPQQARVAAEAWSQIPYPVFHRLAFFAAVQDGVVSGGQGLEWLLSDDNWWLWSIETRRETMRLLVALAPQLDEVGLLRLEQAILAGPPREMYRADIEEERWLAIHARGIWLRLAKMRMAGAELSAAARERLDGLSATHPDWQLAEDQRDEFPTWSGDSGEMLIRVTTPRDRNELLGWLRENLEPVERRPDDWGERCRDDFGVAASVLAALAAEEIWPKRRWEDALQRWSDGRTDRTLLARDGSGIGRRAERGFGGPHPRG